MGKIQDQDFHKLPQTVTDFKDNVLAVLNNGKAQFQVVSAAPTFAGNAGEITLYRSGTAGRVYCYMGTSWNLIVSFTADAA